MRPWPPAITDNSGSVRTQAAGNRRAVAKKSDQTGNNFLLIVLLLDARFEECDGFGGLVRDDQQRAVSLFGTAVLQPAVHALLFTGSENAGQNRLCLLIRVVLGDAQPALPPEGFGLGCLQ